MTQQQIEAMKMALDLATMHHTDDGYAALRAKVRSASKEALAQPEQEPVIDKSAAKRIATALGWTPQRKPLTDEQIWDAYMKAPVDIDCHVSDLHKFARAIEAKLKENT